MAGTFFDTFLPAATASAAGGGIGALQGKNEGQFLLEELQKSKLGNEILRWQAELMKRPQPFTAAQGSVFGTTDPLTGRSSITGQVPLQPRPLNPVTEEMERAKTGFYGAQTKNLETGGGLKPPSTVLEQINRKEAAGIPLTEFEKNYKKSVKQDKMDVFRPAVMEVVDPKDPKRVIKVDARTGKPIMVGGSAAESPRWAGGGVDYATRKATEISFGPGLRGTETRSINVAMNHVGTLNRLALALKNEGMQGFNRVANATKKEFGGVAPASFEAAVTIVAPEIAKAMVGGGVTALGDRQEAGQAIAMKNTPDQWGGAGGISATLQELMGGKLTELERQYVEGGGTKDFRMKLSPVARELLNKSQQQQGGATTTTSTKANPAQRQEAAERFEMLIDGGMGEDEAYATLQQEGY